MQHGAQMTETREETLAKLVREHQSALTRLCFLSLRDEELARDAVQETFLKAFEALSRFRGDSSERTWLFSIALNVCRDMHRANWFRFVDRRITPEMLEHMADFTDSGVELSIAISGLPYRLREAVLLYYYQGMTVEEMAEVLHAAKSTVSVRLKQARDRLHITLEGGDDHD
ncbi:MAG: sigma-70 family RNA polymerase sigma factor [Christensenellaceae bacterium]|nr:sigma-70 family RNA polymerase sigma factor [Christensenellaceae bacterium]